MLYMKLSYSARRQRAVAIVFWTAIILGIVAMLLPMAVDVSTPVAVTLLSAAALFALWVQWQNGRGGFGMVRGHGPTYETRATLSAGRWLLLLILLLSETAVLALVIVGQRP